MRVLVACEFSGTVRDAFQRAGHVAMSCDLLASEGGEPHYNGDVRDLLGQKWDLMIAHPPCTYLCLSGVRWLYEQEGRWEQMQAAAAFFRLLLGTKIPRVAVENPIPHRYAVESIGCSYDQKIHPWQFGHGESKTTCLWLQNLPQLVPTDIVEGRSQRIWRMSPSPVRSLERSRTYAGIADAMARQWGAL